MRVNFKKFIFVVSPSVQVQKALVGAPFGANAKLKCDVQAFPHSNNYWITEHDEDILNGFGLLVAL